MSRRKRNWALTAIAVMGLLVVLPVASCNSNGQVPDLESVLVIPRTSSLEIGETAQCMAIAAYSDGSAGDVTQGASWASSDTAVATVSSAGLVTANAGGTAVISAVYQDEEDSVVVKVGAPPVTLVSIKVLPAQASVEAGQTQQYSASAVYSDDSTADVTGNVTWETSNPVVVTISSGGLARGVSAGVASIVASLGDLSDSVSIQVTAPAGPPQIPAWHSSYDFDQCAACHAPGANPGAPDWPADHPPDPTCDIPGCHAWA